MKRSLLAYKFQLYSHLHKADPVMLCNCKKPTLRFEPEKEKFFDKYFITIYASIEDVNKDEVNDAQSDPQRAYDTDDRGHMISMM